MTTTRALAELFRAIAAGDLQTANDVAQRICDSEARKGHRGSARQLKGALQSQRRDPSSGTAPSSVSAANSATFFTSALVRLPSDNSLGDVTLPKAARAEIESVVEEWKFKERLQSIGISPRSKLLFHGPPGCGKSLTAQALGRELGLPVFMVRFDAVIGAFLGQTAIHLRQLFHFAETTPCILLLDELDALGKKRGSPLDVGELDRIVISLLQELEHSKPLGVVVATTNLAKHLDDALWRRFDLEIGFPRPSRETLRSYVAELGRRRGVTLQGACLSKAIASRSFADAEKVALGEFRRQALTSYRRK